MSRVAIKLQLIVSYLSASFDFIFTKTTIAMSTISTTRRTMMTPPTAIPPISPTLAPPPLCRAATLGLATVGLVRLGGAISQSGDLRVSREVPQVGSRRRREDWTMTEALPLPTQDCMRETSPGALYVSVPTILAL